MSELTVNGNSVGGLQTADGTPLKAALAKTERQKRVRAVMLVAPLFLFLFATFLYPIALMLFRSVDNPLIAENMPLTIQALQGWKASDGLPDEVVFAALVSDLREARANKRIGKVATRLNFENSGLRSVVTRTARKTRSMEAPFKEKVLAAHDRWGEVETWATIKLLGNTLTPVQFLASVDKKINAEGDIENQPEERQIYVTLFQRTLAMSLIVTIACLLLGFPIAYLLSILPTRHSNLLMILVLLPFWTSLLVRTTSWIVLLQTQGVINDILVFLHIIDEAGRFQMIFNAQGTVVSMTQILLPFMVLPLFSVMKTISPSYMKAAQSLGAHRFLAFRKVYLPNTLPGIGAGALLVFILAIGYYITPALVGGQDGQMISNLIAFHMQKSLNWGLAAALGSILLAGVIALYWLYNKIVGVERLALG